LPGAFKRASTNDLTHPKAILAVDMKMKFHHRIPITHQVAGLALAGWLTFGFCPPVMAAVKPEPDIRRDATVEVIEKVMPCVVNIATARIVEYHDLYDELLREFYGVNRPGRRQEEPFNAGSGVIIDEDGYVLTNFHVVRGASRVQVKLSDGSIYDAEPQYVATQQKDVALLKIKLKPGEHRKFKAIKLAKDDDLLLGETVLALGNPYGLGGSVSRGILSSKNRRVAPGDEPLNYPDWLQTDAAINPGNSGGPLVDLRGELIGINVAVLRKGEGMGVGFAIPVKQISEALSDFFMPEAKDSLWFGAHVVQSGSDPLVIADVQNGSPADKSGLRPGQRVLQVNGQTPKGLVDFNRLVTAKQNHEATFQVEDHGEQHTVKTQLVPFDDLIRQKLGLVLLNLAPQTAARFPVQPGEGLFISEVTKNGPAERAQLQRGFLMTAIDGRSTGNLMSVADVLSTKKSGDPIDLTVMVPRRVGPNYVEYRQATVTLTVR
jgi:S1-C subfamily serine protease